MGLMNAVGSRAWVIPKPQQFSQTRKICRFENSHFFSKMSSSRESEVEAGEPIRLEEWQAWGSVSPVPSAVDEVIRDLKLLEKQINAPMTFDGNHGTLSGVFKIHEDKKHRQKYASLSSSEEKLQFFSARQIACRLLGSRGYLCQKCWLARSDCMCSRVNMCALWPKLRLWLYMHPKDFLRQNNTGKLLWQIFGIDAVSLCLYGIAEHEEMMWNSFIHAGRDKVWCLYPSNNAATVSDAVKFLSETGEDPVAKENPAMHFILIDGTWNNSTAMLHRLQDKAKALWDQELCCMSLNTGVSAMHKLRPQPSWDRTCTAAAAVALLHELHHIPELSYVGLEEQVNALESSLEVLLEALTTRRRRMGRSVSRKIRHNRDIC